MAGKLWTDKAETGPWHRFLIADAFTSTPLQGNQLGVFPDGAADRVERVLVGGSAVIVARGEYRLG